MSQHLMWDCHDLNFTTTKDYYYVHNKGKVFDNHICLNEMTWLKNFLEKLDNKDESTALFYNNRKLIIYLMKNPMLHSRTKHI